MKKRSLFLALLLTIAFVGIALAQNEATDYVNGIFADIDGLTATVLGIAAMLLTKMLTNWGVPDDKKTILISWLKYGLALVAPGVLTGLYDFTLPVAQQLDTSGLTQVFLAIWGVSGVSYLVYTRLLEPLKKLLESIKS